MNRRASSVAVVSLVKGKLPRLPFTAMKTRILGPRYALSLAFVPPRLSRTLNRKYRQKDAPTDILSFPLGPAAGEILIDLATARREAEKFSRRGARFIGFLFIHGLLHLKGRRHGSTMEREEAKFRKIFGV